MARRRVTVSSGTEKRVLGDLAFRELLGRALPLLSDDDRRIIELIKSGCTVDEMGELMNLTHEGGSDAHIAHAQQELVRACRTVAAAASLLEEGSSCPEFASHANWWRRLLERRMLLLVKFTEASEDYKREHSAPLTACRTEHASCCFARHLASSGLAGANYSTSWRS